MESSWFITALGDCYGCRSFGHFSRKWPSHREIVFSNQRVPLIKGVHRPAEDGIHGHRGGFQHSHGYCQEGRIGDQLGAQQSEGYSQLYTIPAKPKVESSDAIITSIILVYHQLALALFDLRCNYSYVSAYYAQQLELS